MRERKRPNLMGFIPIGCGLVAVGIATENMGLTGAGVVFLMMGVVNIVSIRKTEDGSDE